MPLRAAVFDFDGVLVDSEPLHYRALRDALLPEGVEITEEEYVRTYLAYDDRGAIRKALEHHGEPADPERMERVEARKVRAFADIVHEIPVFEGAPRARARARGGDAGRDRLGRPARRDRGESSPASACATPSRRSSAPRTPSGRSPTPPPTSRRRGGSPHARPASPRRTASPSRTRRPGIAAALGAGMKVVGVAHSYPAEKLRAAHRVVDSLAGLDAGSLRGLFAS